MFVLAQYALDFALYRDRTVEGAAARREDLGSTYRALFSLRVHCLVPRSTIEIGVSLVKKIVAQPRNFRRMLYFGP